MYLRRYSGYIAVSRHQSAYASFCLYVLSIHVVCSPFRQPQIFEFLFSKACVRSDAYGFVECHVREGLWSFWSRLPTWRGVNPDLEVQSTIQVEHSPKIDSNFQIHNDICYVIQVLQFHRSWFYCVYFFLLLSAQMVHTAKSKSLPSKAERNRFG